MHGEVDDRRSHHLMCVSARVCVCERVCVRVCMSVSVCELIVFHSCGGRVARDCADRGPRTSGLRSVIGSQRSAY